MLLAAAAVLPAALTLVFWTGSRRQQRALSAEVERLTRTAASGTPQSPIEMDALPAPR